MINFDLILENVKNMLLRRGYDDIKFIDLDNKPRITATRSNETVNVFFVIYMKVTVNVIKSIISISNSNHIIIINTFPLTPDARQTLNNMPVNSTDKELFKFELFSSDEMSYDIIPIVPKHLKIQNSNRIKEWSKLPILLTSDIVSRYYNFQSGDIIEITEDCGTLSYRRCL
jgi:DNA-directed RNA polymerase subunit H (RpoH/RPB5)